MNAKQQRFVDYYLVSLDATDAARQAGYKHPTVQGSRLLTNVNVRKAVDAAQLEQSKRSELNADWVLARLRDKAEADGVPASAAVRATELIGKHVGMFHDTLRLELAAHPEFVELLTLIRGALCPACNEKVAQVIATRRNT